MSRLWRETCFVLVGYWISNIKGTSIFWILESTVWYHADFFLYYVICIYLTCITSLFILFLLLFGGARLGVYLIKHYVKNRQTYRGKSLKPSIAYFLMQLTLKMKYMWVREGSVVYIYALSFYQFMTALIFILFSKMVACKFLMGCYDVMVFVYLVVLHGRKYILY